MNCTKVSSELECGGEAPICKHWRSRGFCLFGERCAFRHPPGCLNQQEQERAQLAAQQAVLNSSNSGRRGGARAGQRRKEPKNKFRASTFRRFLIDTFGREVLRQGTGVLDVAGGRGELAFELLNLNGVPATVVEPRPLDLARRVKWLMVGFYHWNAAFAHYNDRQPAAPPAEQLKVDGATERQQQGARMPDHLRLVVTPELAACLTGRPSSSSGGSGSSKDVSNSADSSSVASAAASGPHSCAAAPPEWAALLEAARAQARRGEWLQPAVEHGGDEGPSAHAFLLGSEESTDSLQGDADGNAHRASSSSSSSGSSSDGTRSGASSPEPVATPALASPRRRALAWTIPAEDSDSEAEGEAPALAASRRRRQQQHQQHAVGSFAAPALLSSSEEPGGPSQQQGQQQAGQQQAPLLRADPAAVAAAQAAAAAACASAEVADPAAAWQRFTQCSVVCGMHPDGATEFIVDLALALGKPFAVVPCCVFAPGLPRQSGGTTSRYEQFLSYLAAKDPTGKIQVATLPFEGRNKVLYRLP
ncbi:hypothetical protein ABPG75_006780 [Micractinium tetrahymenae]